MNWREIQLSKRCDSIRLTIYFLARKAFLDMKLVAALLVFMDLATAVHGVSLCQWHQIDLVTFCSHILVFTSPTQARTGGNPGSLAEQEQKFLAHMQDSRQSLAPKPFTRPPAMVPHDALASTEKYIYSSVGASASASWQTPGCEFSNSMYLFAVNSASKYILDGSPPTTSNDKFGSFQLITYTDCYYSTATVTYAFFDIYSDSDAIWAFDVASDLGSASLSTCTNSSIVTESCLKVCYERNDDDDIIINDDDGDGTYCYYDNCTIISEEYGTADLDVSWVGDSIPSNSSSRSKYDSVGYSYRNSDKGQERIASVTAVSYSFAGEAFDFPYDTNFTGYLQKYKSTSTYTSN